MRALLGCVIAASLMMPVAVKADDCHGPSFFDAIQKGKTVELKFFLSKDAEVNMDTEYHFTRNDEVIIPAKIYEAEDADSEGATCHGGGDPDWCAENEGMCVDCDGDDVPECVGTSGCETIYYFTEVDDCAPPGETRYRLIPCGGWEDLDIEDVGQDCDLGTDPDTDAGTDADSDSDRTVSVS